MTTLTAPRGTGAEIRFERSADLIDLARARRDRIRWVDVEERRFLAIDGEEEPGGLTFQHAVATLYPVAYTLHFALRARGVRAPVGMLEGLMWIPEELLLAEVPTTPTAAPPHFRWRLLLAVPEAAGEREIEEAIVAAARKRELPLASVLRVVSFAEGPSAQLLHVGPYGAETATLRTLHEAIATAGYVPRGPHHEIYLNDPHQVGEDRARTVLRQPVAAAEQEHAAQ